ncbi:MAG TPA: hypothetical protein VN461_00670 [Vicinamibacteria bacterium]|nr:hypothetical protein [Vicinamibacteria bacterium]
MDRLIALIVLRWRMDVRALLGARERILGLLLAVPGLLLFAGLASFFTYFGLRLLENRQPEAVLPVVSAAATLLGLFWTLSPLLAGVAFSETHDLSRLLHFPIPLPLLVVASLGANLLQPMVLTQIPLLLSLTLSVAGGLGSLPLCGAGVALAYLFVLAAAQVMGLLFQGLARNRRLQDRALFFGLGLGFLLSLLPLLFMAGGGRSLAGLLRFVVATDLFAVSPFAWGLRAAVHAGRGEALPFLFYVAAAGGGLLGAVFLSASLARRIYRGELELGSAPARAAGAPAPMLFSGDLGALLEKDLRVTWRDPRLKAVVFTSLVGPLLLLFLVWQGSAGRVAPAALLALASLTGLSTFGANAFALERRGLILLVGFPVPRWRVLAAKNAGVILLRLPSLLLLLLATVLLAPPPLAAPVATVGLLTMLIGAGVDNFLSILFPVAVPAPGRNPYGPVSGGRGLGAAAVAAALMMGALLVSSPFSFLAWLPLLLGEERLWLLTLPLALAGAAAIYATLLGAAARLLQRREPDLLGRVLGEE